MSHTDWDAYSAFYEKVAEPYEADIASLRWGMHPNLSVLEVGIGTGRVAALFAPQAKRYLGIDVSSGMLGLMEGKGIKNVSVFHGDFMHFSTSERFDRILMPYRVLHYLNTWELALEKAYALLVPCGMLFVDIHIKALKEEWVFYEKQKIFRVRQKLNVHDVQTTAIRLGFKIMQQVKTQPFAVTMWLEKCHENRAESHAESTVSTSATQMARRQSWP
jgi:SAM-dependent methyltransferase